MNRESIHRYPSSMAIFHGLVALVMVSTLVIGWLLDDNEGLMALHKSLGVTVLLLVTLRLVNRWRMRRALPASVNPAGSLPFVAEKAVHGLLYLSMFGIPLLGWLKSNASGHPASCFGLFDLPTLIGRDHGLSHLLGQAHSLAATGFALLLGLHILGALAHRVIHKENIFKRIMP